MSTELEVEEGLARIRVPLDRSADEPGPDHEWLWAEPLGSERYRIESCPFFAYGVSRNDVVRTAPRSDEDAPRLEDVVEKGGHRTLRFALDPGAELSGDAMQRLLDRLLELGCTHEALRPKIVSIDLPPEVDVSAVAEALQSVAREGLLVWEWADPRLS